VPEPAVPAAPPAAPGDWKKEDPDPGLHWGEFVASLGNSDAELNVPMLRQCGGEVRGGWLVLRPYTQIAAKKLKAGKGLLEDRASAWAGRRLECVFLPPQKIVRTEAELIQDMEKHPVVQRLAGAFDAEVVHVKD
jgi:hypothetical protein